MGTEPSPIADPNCRMCGGTGCWWESDDRTVMNCPECVVTLLARAQRAEAALGEMTNGRDGWMRRAESGWEKLDEEGVRVLGLHADLAAATARAERAEAAEADLRAKLAEYKHAVAVLDLVRRALDPDRIAQYSQIVAEARAALDAQRPAEGGPDYESPRRICWAQHRGMLCNRLAGHQGDHVDIYGPLLDHTWPAALDGGQPDTPAPTEERTDG